MIAAAAAIMIAMFAVFVFVFMGRVDIEEFGVGLAEPCRQTAARHHQP